MRTDFRACNRDIAMVLPPTIQEWVRERDLARFIVDIVDGLNIDSIIDAYTGKGSKPYHPRMLLSLLFYGYATGIFSSRKLEWATYDSISFRFITGNTHPDHDTIANFRKRFLENLKPLFVQILLIAQQMGLLKLGKVSLDGTKVKANASKHHALSWKHACKLEEQLKAEVEELLFKAKKADKEQQDSEMDIPEEIVRREDRLKGIADAKAEIERRANERFAKEKEAFEVRAAERLQKEKETGKKTKGTKPKPPEPGPRDKDQVNLTDSESRIMPSSSGFEQAYNAQACVDIETNIIVENHVTQHTNDKLEVEPTLENLVSLPEELGKVKGILADTGYNSEPNVLKCEKKGITPYIAGAREKHHLPPEERFKEPDPIPEDSDPVTKMKHRLKTIEGRAVYAKRKSTIEPAFGVIKQVLGFRQFLLRGLDSVAGEWNLVSIAYNLKKLHVLAA